MRDLPDIIEINFALRSYIFAQAWKPDLNIKYKLTERRREPVPEYFLRISSSIRNPNRDHS